MTEIAVVGAGHVGLVTATCFAELGHNVKLVESDPERLGLIRRGQMPTSEPGLVDLWQRHMKEGRLHLTAGYLEGLDGCQVVFICVGTPSCPNGEPDLASIRRAVKGVAQAATGNVIVVNKSTVPIGTADLVSGLIARHKNTDHHFAVVSNPEFLREGRAVFDFLHPSRVVVGSNDEEAALTIAQLYEPLGCAVVITDAATAEMSKYASNAFLAVKISFINEIASLCDKSGVDVKTVAKIMGLDRRIGPAFFEAGLGWGGSCLPKDVRGLIYTAHSMGIRSPLLRSALSVNLGQPEVVVRKLRSRLGPLAGKTVGILGLSFKPNCDDMREATSLAVISLLQGTGCRIRAYDPVVGMENAVALLSAVKCCLDAYEAASGCDALVLVTEWPEFRQLDLRRLRSLMNDSVFIDGRNMFDPEEINDAGFVYEGIGRRSVGQERTAPVLTRREKREAQLPVGEGVSQAMKPANTQCLERPRAEQFSAHLPHSTR